ncbi:MAG: hypothetical protein CSB19_01970 [Clostridiales bacterium]|nr:MAG: hypothetical protein CSB19_01970 [Clostridiales bacterium]
MTVKQNFSLKRALLFQLVGVLLILLLSQLFANYVADYNARQKIKLGLIVEDEHRYINLLLNNFTSNEDFTALFDIITADRNAIINDFNANVLDAYVVIPDAFTDNLLYYRDNNIDIYTHFGFPTKTKILKSLFSAYSHFVQTANITTLSFYDLLTESTLSDEAIRDANNQFSLEIISTTIGRNDLFDVQVRNELSGISTSNYFIIALSFAIIGFATIPLVIARYDEMNSCVSDRLLASGLPIPLYLAGLHGGNALTTLIQTTLFAIAWAIYSGLSPITVTIGFIAISLFWSSLWLSLIMTLKNRQLFFVSSLIICFILAVLGGSLTPYTIMPLNLKLLSQFSPILTLTKLSLGLTFKWQALLSWFALLAGLLIQQYYLIATRRYGVKK